MYNIILSITWYIKGLFSRTNVALRKKTSCTEGDLSHGELGVNPIN